MTELVIQAAAITVIFVRGTIFNWLRRIGPAWWRELVSCALCSGFWIGGAWYARTAPWRWEAFAAGALTGVLALLVVRVLEFLEALSD